MPEYEMTAGMAAQIVCDMYRDAVRKRDFYQGDEVRFNWWRDQVEALRHALAAMGAICVQCGEPVEALRRHPAYAHPTCYACLPPPKPLPIIEPPCPECGQVEVFDA